VLEENPFVGSIRGRGLMIGIEIVQDRQSKITLDSELLVGRRICEQAISQGVWIRPLGDVVVLMPPLSISEAELDMLADAVIASVENVTGNLKV
jgi:adenosylmethionine-8-amino-7-oxononanoate aminotransferase